MIKEESINEVRAAMSVEDVIQRCGVELKKRGASLLGLCPFHNEKSGSFNVNPARGFYKCFGCGKGGDAIRFVMEYEKRSFIEAVERIAEMYSIRLQHTKQDPEEEKQYGTRLELMGINKAAARLYQKNLLQQEPNVYATEAMLAREYLQNNRQLTQDTIIQWQLGYAPDNWKFLAPVLVEKALFVPGIELGLVATKNDSNYDIFRNRIIFPIHDIYGNVIAFGGRTMGEVNSNNPKYINSKESALYKKEKVLFGIHFAAKAIREKKCAILVEGYTDVISFHQHGACNTVATCGTALTAENAKELKRYTSHVILCRDADEAGMKATMKDIDILIHHDLKVDVLPLPEGDDPDTFARKCIMEESSQEILSHEFH